MKKILVVENEENWQRELRTILKGAGYKVKVVSNKMDAIRAFESETPNLAVIDMSLILEDPDDRQGWEVMEAADIPVVVVSGYLRPSEVEKLHHKDLAEWFFAKDEFDDEEFLKAVEDSILSSEIDLRRRWRELERQVQRRYRRSD